MIDQNDDGTATLETVSPYYIASTATSATVRPHVLKRGDTFAILDLWGNAQATGPAAEGVFFEDTRYLSQLTLTIDGVRPLLLSSTVNEDNTVLTVDLTNPDMTTAEGDRLLRDTVHILSGTTLGGEGLSQRVSVKNFGMAPANFRLRLGFDADFADIFEVRGATRPRRGNRLSDIRSLDEVTLQYAGLDGSIRKTRIVLSPAPKALMRDGAEWSFHLAPHEEAEFQLTILCHREGGEADQVVTRTVSLTASAEWLATRKASVVDIYTSNERFNDWLSRSRADLEMLITETPQGPYAYAGIPWFSTAFGRDGIITALECLWLDPSLAAGTLRFLAENQAQATDPKTDAEPGKILHETRKGEMAALGEVPFGRYYGSVDSTPLFIVLAAAYYARTGDLDLITEIWPNIEAALEWIAAYGDRDGDGFIEYDRQSVNGLINQGWKDSSDSIFHEDGLLADAPIALAEVQAYVYAAYRGAATLAWSLGHFSRVTELESAAERLKDRFEAVFWLDDLGTYALALDGHKKPCRVRASNAGHVLFGRLASPERAGIVAKTLMEPASFSKWGIRTVAENEARYNPLSYHNGSVWPHDNGVIAMGFGNYGLKQPLLKVLTALFDATLFMDLSRLPELFCGFGRRAGVGPTAYPVACVPQAWSSATVFAMLGAMLGISFDPSARRVSFFQPSMPDWLDECRLSNLRLGTASLDLLLRRTREDVVIHVLRREGPIEIALTI